MDNNNMVNIPYIAHEAALERAERRDKWHISVIVLLITLLVLSNLAWIIAWSQFDYIDEFSIDATQDGAGVNLISGGEMNYGATSDNQAAADEGAQ